MLKEAMRAHRVHDMEFAPEICDLLEAAYLDLKSAGVVIEGECSFTITETEDQETGETVITVEDNSTITDKQVIQAMKTYVGWKATFIPLADRESFGEIYEKDKKRLGNTTGYTDFGEGAGT